MAAKGVVASQTLECIVLKRDVPEYQLRKGDIGTIVETYASGGLEVEFVNAAGEILAVVTLSGNDVRKATRSDMLAARPS